MIEQIEARRAELQAEYTRGQQAQVQMNQELATLEQTLLRISGAIQLCNEFLTQPAPVVAEGGADGNHS